MALATGVLSGVVPILVTPFDDDGAIDEASLRNEVDFAIDAGVHGLGIALGSEIFKLTEAERDRVATIVVDQTRDRVPVVVNTGAAGATGLAVFYSQRAQNLGASGVMCTPPGPGFSAGEVVSYFRAISDAVDIPIVIQDTNATPVPASLILAIAESCANATYAKVESAPPAVQVHKAVQAVGDRVRIFGGAGGGQFLPELRRGSIGTMPFPSSARAFVEVWDRWQRGDLTGARSVFDQRILPLLNIGIGTLGAAHIVHKLALQRQGVIRNAHVRSPVEDLDPVTREELDEAFARLGWSA
ncbi:MAG: dihydrodipicolinate synthase family protein [Chloroflexota bacterium]|nr:dihydrodipicolinate synthase family protein [Chloroflexia bacterium]MDQ3443770.1 dihydrodipicolinate synthase family protein [Chloroflexota bacterium]